MKLANSILLLAALCVSTLARPEQHARRILNNPPTVTTPVGAWVSPQPTHLVNPQRTPLIPQPNPPKPKTKTNANPQASLAPQPVQSPGPNAGPKPSSQPGSQNGAKSGWASLPANGIFSKEGFGGNSSSRGQGVSYAGNVGIPYGSNIIEVSAGKAKNYKYVAQFSGSNKKDWTVVIWNKIDKSGKMGGWFGNACRTFTLPPGAKKYFAFDEDSQGGWAAAEGSSVPTRPYLGYVTTWGEFDFGSSINKGGSGFDVSAIVAQNATMPIMGMKICDVLTPGSCSSITKNAGLIQNAYTALERDIGGIGGNLAPNPVRLDIHLDYNG